MPSFADLISNEPKGAIRSKIVGLINAAGSQVSKWSATGQAFLSMAVDAAFDTTTMIPKAVRGLASLDTSVDPGDDDPYDPTNVNLVPAPGFLSTLGESVYNTKRDWETYAEGPVKFVNDGPVARNIAPGGLVFQWTENAPPAPLTYSNVPDDSVYTNPDGTVTVEKGASLTITVMCDVPGAIGSCPSGSLSLVTTLSGCSATNTAPVVGDDRQTAPNYRALCRDNSAMLSLIGTRAGYRYLARRNIDGTPLLNKTFTPPNPVGITRVWVSDDSSYGTVSAYYASDDGPASESDTAVANANIIANMIGVRGPTDAPDLGSIVFNGTPAAAVTINVSGTASIDVENKPETMTQGDWVASIQNAIASAVEFSAPKFPIGGLDVNTAGVGQVYTTDLQSIALSAYPRLYNVRVTSPSAESTSVSEGQVVALRSLFSDWTITVVTNT